MSSPEPVDHAPPRPIVLCADDYGMNAGIDAAICDLAGRGRISATSCMTNAPGFANAAPALGAFPNLGVGLHLTLTWGQPLGVMPRWTIDGRMPSLRRAIQTALIGDLPMGEIEGEIDRQIDAFVAVVGRQPDFIDGHQHVHALPGVRSALLSRLVRRGLARRLWLRDPGERPTVAWRRPCAAKALFVAALASGFGEAAAGSGFRTNIGFSGFSAFDPGRNPDGDMAGYLQDLGPSPLVMCHPGEECGDPDDEIAAARSVEYRYLGSDAFAARLRERQATLVASPA